ncbi:hypothetical protein CCACVL1_18950 [Corchorus capsularis]|uniref:Uncharacterized protein n=2 Tax=Corchorus TaxID=93758 RepID=A0A1R3HJ86_COCAP|nr:GTPase-activating protein gyp7 [Corchorus olitorius]OMO70381.1 hypothetical protein CCACVL1_18950 [Corchorus capsularis]
MDGPHKSKRMKVLVQENNTWGFWVEKKKIGGG